MKDLLMFHCNSDLGSQTGAEKIITPIRLIHGISQAIELIIYFFYFYFLLNSFLILETLKLHKLYLLTKTKRYIL
jgi:hypothetical protein